MTSGALPRDADIASSLRDILASPEFQPDVWNRHEHWFNKWLLDVLHWLAELNPALRWLLIVICLALLAVLVFQIWQFYRRAQQPLQPLPTTHTSRPVTQLTVDTAFEQALRLAARGLLRDAARALQHALWLHLSHQRGIPWHSQWVDSEWLGALNASPAAIALTKETQSLAYGPAPTQDAFTACATRFKEIVNS